jgi:hypothetical protein
LPLAGRTPGNSGNGDVLAVYDPGVGQLRLRPFERRDLPLAEPWFLDADTQRWLGGPLWPRQMLDLAERPLGEFRGATEAGRYRWLAWDDGRAVGYVDCGTYDRWTTWEGGPGGRGVTSVIPVPAGIGLIRRPGVAASAGRACADAVPAPDLP